MSMARLSGVNTTLEKVSSIVNVDGSEYFAVASIHIIFLWTQNVPALLFFIFPLTQL